MPRHRTPRHRTSRHQRPRALVLLTALTAAVALILPTTGASAAKPGAAPAPPAAGSIVVSPLTNVAGLPDAAGTPDVLIDTDLAFSVQVTLAGGVYSTRDATLLEIATSNGALTGTRFASVPAGGSTATFTGLHLAVANGVVLTVTPVDRKAARDLGTGSSAPFDVVTDTELVDVEAGTEPLVVTKSGVPGVPCQPTPEVPTCVDVLLPAGIAGDDVFFSTGTCAGGIGCRNADLDVLQVLADLGTLYTKTSPATLVVKCDKSLCGVGAIQRNVLRASLEPTGDLAAVGACAAKGVIGTDQESCVDFVQSKRDGSGDTYLYWLVPRDARMSIG